MLVIRVEDKEGCGPWHSSKYPFESSDIDHHYSSKCPQPNDDGIELPKRTRHHYYCGVLSVDLYQQWFTKENREELKKAKFKVKLYKIHKNCVKFGENQIMFKKEKAKVINEFDPTNVEKIKEFINT